MKKLIINADDFGTDHWTNKGIIQCIKAGIVRSVSVLPNMPFTKEISIIAKNFPSISIGVHFNLTTGKPVLPPKKIPSLVNKNGCFWGNKFRNKLLIGHIKTADIKRELMAQVRKLSYLVPDITHFDSHQHIHLYFPIFVLSIIVAKKYKINKTRCYRRYLFVEDLKRRSKIIFKYYLNHPYRFITHNFTKILTKIANFSGIKTADRLISPEYIGNTKKYLLKTWTNIIDTLPSGVSEIYCHPGYSDSTLKKYTPHTLKKKAETEVLTSPELKKHIENSDVKIISFKEL